MKQCKTCKWFEKKTCFYEPPPWAHSTDNQAPDISESCRCSRWDTKLERRCINCEFFNYNGGEPCECRHSTPNSVGSWPKVFMNDWCGEFRGKE